jgi:catechol 2,3-dioxygenase-like lactoylglutathione lyase family enzyme
LATQVQVTFDCADPEALSTFWAAALGYRLQDPPEGFSTWEAFLADLGVPEDEWNSASAVVDPDGGGPRLYFQRVPEPKVAKNRVHLDLNVGGPPGTALDERKATVDREVKRIADLGAEVVRAAEERGEYWVVMRDPEGNEFCLQ